MPLSAYRSRNIRFIVVARKLQYFRRRLGAIPGKEGEEDNKENETIENDDDDESGDKNSFMADRRIVERDEDKVGLGLFY